MCSLVKLYLKELPAHDEGIIPRYMRRELVDAAYMEEESERVTTMQKVLTKLPRENYHVLRCVVHHFYLVQLEKNTRMTAKSLAMCFMPRLAHAIEMLVLGYPDIYASSETDQQHDEDEDKNTSSGPTTTSPASSNDVRPAVRPVDGDPDDDPDANTTFSAPLDL